MKKFFSVLLVGLACSFNSFGQDYNDSPIRNPSTVYLGFGTGLNNYVGLIGPTIEYQFAHKFTVFGGVGLGSWGGKVSAGARYYLDYPGRLAFGLSYSRTTGLENIEFNMPTQDVVGMGRGNKMKVPFRLKGSNTINLTVTRNWIIGSARKNRFHLDFGYAMPLGDNNYELKDGYQLTSEGKDFINSLQPGGLILGLGFSFGLN